MYKIEDVKIMNFKSISELELSCNGESRSIVGVNGAGKSSAMDGIIMGLTGELTKSNGKKLNKKDYYTLLAPNTTQGNIIVRLKEVETGKIIVIGRKVKKNGEELITLKYEDDSPIKMDIMDNLISQFAINPYNFINLTPQQQAKMVGVDTDEYDKQIAELKSELSIANKEKLRLGKVIPSDAPEKVEKVSSSDILNAIEEVNQHNARVDKANSYIESKKEERKVLEKKQQDYQAEIDRLNALIMDTEEEVIKVDKAIITAEDKMKAENLTEYKDREDLVSQLKNIEEVNKRADEYERYLEGVKQLDESKAEYDKISSQIADLEAQKVKYLQSQSFPKEVSIDDKGGLLINGRELDETSFNHAKVMEIILALLKRDDSTLKTIFIKDGNLYDNETLVRLEKLGYQLLIEVVKSEIPTEKVIYIKESKVVDNLEKTVEKEESLFDF